MNVILRPATERDFSAVERILEPWIREDPGIGELLSNLFARSCAGQTRCRLLESDGTVKCVSLWVAERPDHVHLMALGLTSDACGCGDDIRFLREEIMGWAEMGVTKVTVRVPEKLAGPLVPCLRNCGFMYEGMSSSCCDEADPWVTFCKHFLYRTISGSEVLGFFQDFLLSLGYEVRTEGEGFTYRVRSEFRLPFIFSSWHRVARSGKDLVLQPPARVLEWNELETLFYPFRIHAETEKPLLVPLERKTAANLIDVPVNNNHQNSLFEPDLRCRIKTLANDNLAYIDPTGIQGVRKGLPLLFYINRVGAVGTARVDEWVLEDARSLLRALREKGWTGDGELTKNSAISWPKSGKVLAVKFHWYQPLKRPVRLEEIRALDRAFSPQRVRCLTSDLFQSIVSAGGTPQDM